MTEHDLALTERFGGTPDDRGTYDPWDDYGVTGTCSCGWTTRDGGFYQHRNTHKSEVALRHHRHQGNDA